MAKKFKRRDGFRGEKMLFCGPHPFTINPTEKDAKKKVDTKTANSKKRNNQWQRNTRLRN